MDDREIRDRVAEWHDRAQKERDYISQFVFLWFCFNAWLAYESDKYHDRAMINWLKNHRSESSQLRAAFDAAAQSKTYDVVRNLTIMDEA